MKQIKAVIFICAAAVMAAGQFLILSANNYIAGITLSVAALVLAIIGLSGLHEKAAPGIKNIYQNLMRKISEISEKSNAAETKDTSAIKPEKTAIKAASEKIQEKLQVFSPKKQSEKLLLKFEFPKIYIVFLAVIVFFFAQLLFFRQQFTMSVMLMGFDLFLAAAFFFLKEDRIKFEAGLEKGIKLFILITGFAAVVFGWILLINPKVAVQNIGVIFTSIGSVLMFFGMPENDNVESEKNNNEDILFVNAKFLEHPVTKIVLVGVAFAAFQLGRRIMFDPNYSMFSMVFFAVMIAAVFFSLPWINFRERYQDNILLNIFKFIAVVFAVYMAYLGQVDFTKNQINSAVLKYLISGAVFIVMFPIYKKKEEDLPISIKTEVAFVIALIAVSVFLRVYQLDQRPFGLENDEAGGMVSAVKNFWVGQHPIYAYVWELCYQLFGITRLGMRMSGVMIGVISIPVMYFAIRSVFNARVAMFTAVAFTFLRWNLHFGRSGHGTVMAIIAETLAIYFIVQAIKKRDKFTYFLAGLGSGLCWYGVLTGWFVVLAPMAYFLAESLTKRKFFARNYIGIIAFILGFWIFGSQHIHNYFISEKTYFSRIQEVSVFSQDPNAPVKNPAVGIVENTQRVLLMFNHHGDSRQRNSGGNPYEPTIDFVSGMLFAPGFIYAIYYSRYYLFFLLVMIFFSQAAGSIFAIEAPSAMRAVGTMIPMMFFIAVIFDKIWISIRRVTSPKIGKLLWVIVALIPLSFIVKDNYNQYFNRWVGGMDELSTATGMYSQKLGQSYRINLYTGLYYPGHPPYRVYRWDYKVDASSDPLDNDMILAKITDENYAIFFHYDVWSTENYWKQLYPEAEFDSFTHPGFGKMFNVLMIQNEEIKKMRGLRGTAAGKSVKNALPVFSDEDKDKIPYTMALQGKVLIPYYASCSFGNTGTAKAEYTIDGIKLKDKEFIRLAKGFHNIKISVRRGDVSDTLYPYMSLSRHVGNSRGGIENIALNERYFYTMPDNGLRVIYYSGESWKDNPVNYEAITPVPFYIKGGNSNAAKFSGYFDAKDSANYKFAASNNGFAAIVIDNKVYWDNVAGSKTNDNIFKPGMVKTDIFKLTAGKHKIEIYTLNSSSFSMKLSVNGAEPRDFNIGELQPDYSKINYN